MEQDKLNTIRERIARLEVKREIVIILDRIAEALEHLSPRDTKLSSGPRIEGR